jgi:endogenous inhibitor of DNA gyrase (YacG/DUF329 family)
MGVKITVKCQGECPVCGKKMMSGDVDALDCGEGLVHYHCRGCDTKFSEIFAYKHTEYEAKDNFIPRKWLFTTCPDCGKALTNDEVRFDGKMEDFMPSFQYAVCKGCGHANSFSLTDNQIHANAKSLGVDPYPHRK